MELGMNIRNWGPTATREFLLTASQYADQSALDALWFNDHVGFPPVLENNPYGIPLEMSEIIDPLGFGCYLAAATSRIKFGTGVLVIPYRSALLTNKWLTAIQVLSDNRFLLGIGPGYMDEEFKALGVPKTRRGKITDETLAFLRETSKNPVTEVNGQAIKLEPALPCPPIYIGGNKKVAFPRAVKYGDGWMPVGDSPEDLIAPVKELQQMAADAGRGALEVVEMKTLPLEDRSQSIELIQAYKEAGVTHFVHTQAYETTAQHAEVVDQVAGEIRDAVN
ncbi:MAG: LLM class flavin-dependent oxidoreductase [Pseudomonadota bacterium]